MCGIYGIVNFNSEPANHVDSLKLMMSESEYRGPDSQDYRVFDYVFFGFNRLSIIDVDKRSNQPFEIKDFGLSIVFNGEIYNYLEIKADLIGLGYGFQTTSDTEVLLTAYYHYKEAAFDLFNGMWAIAIYDSVNKTVLLSRDRLGIKPLYYMVQNNAFYFASEMKSLLTVIESKVSNKGALNNYLVYGANTTTSGETFVEGIHEFAAGSYGYVKEEGIEMMQYYFSPDNLVDRDAAALASEILDTFKSSIKLRLRADVPVALMLSGGLDSSAIAFAIDEMVENKEIEIQYIHAFTLNFEGFDKNEWNMVQENAKHLKHVVCHPININIELFKQEIPNLLVKFDLPVLSVSHLLHAYAMEEIKKQGFTVVLNGQGPDEIYGGYFPKDLGSLLIDTFRGSIANGFREMKLTKGNWNQGYFLQFKSAVYATLKYKWPKIYAILMNYSVTGKFQVLGLNYPSKKENRKSYFDFISRKQVFDTKFNCILQYEDMASMLNSIEMRSPFLDYRLVNLGLSLPSEYKLRDGYSKWILRKAFTALLPAHICWSGWKFGYAVPKQLLLTGLVNNTKNTEAAWNNAWRKYNLEMWLKARNIR